MTGTGQCMTTSFDCKSFFADPGVQSSAANLCRVVVYEEPEVQGAVNAVSIKTKNSECISASGRSVRLDRTLQSDGSAAPRYVQSMCPNATSWDVSLKGALTMTSTISATGGPDAPSNRTTVIPATITAAEQPPKALLTFRGGILGDVYDQNPSFAALIALSAAFSRSYKDDASAAVYGAYIVMEDMIPL
ncbi:unnamed protein product [Zymoseptoria tritici ST99CH_1A5]|nr:unnamed protein product [Zymoseptoria tritici ST99CH_3D1]SMY20003.1 unnamed protein product [Zymoseptoria tritici ST99CH_1A5]